MFSKRMKQLIASVLTVTMLGTIAPAGAFAATSSIDESEGWVNGYMPSNEVDANGIPLDAVISYGGPSPMIPAPEPIVAMEAIDAMQQQNEEAKARAMADILDDGVYWYRTGEENEFDYSEENLEKLRDANEAVEVTAATTASMFRYELDKKHYVFTEDVTIRSTNPETPNGIALKDGQTTVLEIKDGVTVTVIGYYSTDGWRAGAGIYVPENASLVVMGPGTLIATGGDADEGGKGELGRSGYGLPPGQHAKGGDGGYGGGGAGAGIGGQGASPAKGGAGGDDENYPVGGDGQDSQQDNACGDIYFVNHAKVVAKAGKAGAQDGLTNNHGFNTEEPDADGMYHGGGGGGGGGTAGQAPAFGIGYGGNSGAAGGGGGLGGVSPNASNKERTNGQCGAKGNEKITHGDQLGESGGNGGKIIQADPEKALGKVCATFDSVIEGRNEGDIERGNYVVDKDGKIRDVFAETITNLDNFHPKDGGVYRFTTVMTRRANATESALEIPENAKVVLEISNTADVTFIGGDAEGREGAGAGIHVPESSTLIIIGNGKLNAKGGDGADAVSGHGGGGAGAGIGGTGGRGFAKDPGTRGTGCGTVYISGPLVLYAEAGEAGVDSGNDLGGRMPEYGIGGGGAGGWYTSKNLSGNHGNVYIDYASTHVTGRSHYVHNANIRLDIMGNVQLTGYTDMIHGYFDANVTDEVLYKAILEVANHNGLKKGVGWKVVYPDSNDPDNTWHDDKLKYEKTGNAPEIYRVGHEWRKNIVDTSGGYVYMFATILGRYARTRLADSDNPRDLGNRCWDNVKAYAEKNNLYLSDDMKPLFNALLFYDHYKEPFDANRDSLFIKSNPTKGRHTKADDALQQIDYSFTTVLDRETGRCATISYDTGRQKKDIFWNWARYYYEMGNSTFQCTDGYIGVETFNWMKNIPANASLAEINLPGTHDSGTTHVSISGQVWDTVGDVVTDNLDIIGLILGAFGLATAIPGVRELLLTLTPIVVTYLMIRLPLFFPYLADSIASCQTMSIGEQLNAGIRAMDIRVAYDRDRKNRLNEYTGKQQFDYALSMLKISHGTLGDAPEKFQKLKPYDVTLTDAKKSDGTLLTLADVIQDCETFLQKNDTECVVLLFQKEGSLDEKKADSDYMQAYNVIFNWLEKNKNNKNNHIFALKEGDKIPTMGEAKGNIYIIHSSQYSKYEDHYDVSDVDKINYLKKVLDEATAIPGKTKGILQDYNKQHTVTKGKGNDAGFPKVVFTSTYHLSFDGWKFVFFNGCFTGTPKQIAETVNQFLDTYGFRRGMHYGWFMMNNPTGMATSNIYFSNVFNARKSFTGIKPGEADYNPEPTPDPEPYSGDGGGEQQGIIVVPTDNTETTIQNNVSADVLNKAETAAAQSSTLTMVGGNDTAVNVSAKDASGNTLTGFTDPLVVSIPLTAAEVAKAGDTSKLTIAKVNVDANGNVSFTYMGGSYDATTGRVTGFVDEPGNYVVLEDSDITKLELQINNPTYKDNDVAKHTDVAPIIEESRTLVPLRLVAENLGCNVDWDEMTRTVTIEKDGVVMTMTIDEVIEGFDVAPIIYEDRTMVPIRYIAERLKANVIWVPKTQQIVIVK